MSHSPAMQAALDAVAKAYPAGCWDRPAPVPVSDYEYFKKAARDTLKQLHAYQDGWTRWGTPHDAQAVCARLLNRAAAYRRHAVRAR